jgi:hypothetical protein
MHTKKNQQGYWYKKYKKYNKPAIRGILSTYPLADNPFTRFNTTNKSKKKKARKRKKERKKKNTR